MGIYYNPAGIKFSSSMFIGNHIFLMYVSLWNAKKEKNISINLTVLRASLPLHTFRDRSCHEWFPDNQHGKIIDLWLLFSSAFKIASWQTALKSHKIHVRKWNLTNIGQAVNRYLKLLLGTWIGKSGRLERAIKQVHYGFQREFVRRNCSDALLNTNSEPPSPLETV